MTNKWIVGAAALAAWVSGAFGCSSSGDLAGPGGACAVATDCQEGLICCNEPKGSLTCTDSVSCVQPAGAGGTPTPMPMGSDQGDATIDAPPGPDGAVGQPQGDADGVAIPDAEPPPDQKSPAATDARSPEEAAVHEDASPPPPKDASGAEASGD